METAFKRDQLDNHILEALLKDARTPFAELAKRFNVSAGTIHVRVEKMKQSGINGYLLKKQLKIPLQAFIPKRLQYAEFRASQKVGYK